MGGSVTFFSDVKIFNNGLGWKEFTVKKKVSLLRGEKMISSSSTNVQVNALSITVTLLHQFSAAYKDRYDS